MMSGNGGDDMGTDVQGPKMTSGPPLEDRVKDLSGETLERVA